jgi:hypothetical protein
MDLHADHERGMVDVEAAQAHAAAAGLSVDAENVLYVRQAILDEYELLLGVLVGESGSLSTIGHKYGDDPVSIDAAVAFPERVDTLVANCKKQVLDLLKMADNLKSAAVAYGYTEEQIVAAAPVNPVAAIAAASSTIHSILNPWERG